MIWLSIFLCTVYTHGLLSFILLFIAGSRDYSVILKSCFCMLSVIQPLMHLFISFIWAMNISVLCFTSRYTEVRAVASLHFLFMPSSNHVARCPRKGQRTIFQDVRVLKNKFITLKDQVKLGERYSRLVYFPRC